MYDNIIKLVSESRTVDDYGDMVVQKSERVVFAELKSITQSEFYQAEAVGMKPEIKFVLADYLEYNYEPIIRYQAFNETEEKEYSVIRTYRNGNQIEIICQRGVENGPAEIGS